MIFGIWFILPLLGLVLGILSKALLTMWGLICWLVVAESMEIGTAPSWCLDQLHRRV